MYVCIGLKYTVWTHWVNHWLKFYGIGAGLIGLKLIVSYKLISFRLANSQGKFLVWLLNCHKECVYFK